jgi:signal transduction histidine kinase
MQGAELGPAVGELFSWRLKVTPIAFVMAMLVFTLESAVWKKVAIACLFSGMLAISIAQLRKVRRDPAVATATLPFNGLAVVVFHMGAVAMTGGTNSPILSATVILVFTLALLLPRRWTIAAAVIQCIGVIAMMVGELTVAFPSTPGFLGGATPVAPAATIARGLFCVLFITMAVRIGHRVRSTFEAVGERAVRARDESLASFEAETRTITTMAGEIAHELKNPLATVKGLAQLVSKDVEGKSAERVRVLRREVDRMQGILEEFLNFSRPLVPLSQEDVRLARLCAEVAQLHESIALEKRVTIAIPESSDVTARCDARKVKQIVINLLQNALAVSPPGSTIAIGLTAASAGGEAVARVTVRDEGPGLPEAIAEKIFQPGVTTKAGGSGLGLTVSRALARQHGGDLALTSSAKGCIGELTLPRAGAAQATAGAA